MKRYRAREKEIIDELYDLITFVNKTIPLVVYRYKNLDIIYEELDVALEDVRHSALKLYNKDLIELEDYNELKDGLAEVRDLIEEDQIRLALKIAEGVRDKFNRSLREPIVEYIATGEFVQPVHLPEMKLDKKDNLWFRTNSKWYRPIKDELDEPHIKEEVIEWFGEDVYEKEFERAEEWK